MIFFSLVVGLSQQRSILLVDYSCKAGNNNNPRCCIIISNNNGSRICHHQQRWGADYASTTITQVISALQSSINAKSTYSILEEISKIITEGKGIGGTITYNSGIRLGDGVQITDEDTTIYNPGLTLLTASEKDNLVSAMIHNHNIGLTILPTTDGGGVGGWSTENESAFQYIKGY
jgi:hypothetical protein